MNTSGAAVFQSTQEHSKRRVAYYIPNTNHHDGVAGTRGERVRMTNDLVQNYDLCNDLDIYRPRHASVGDMARFHSEEYLSCLMTDDPEFRKIFPKKMIQKFNVGTGARNPWFEGLFEFCMDSVGGSLAAANKLNLGKADIAINWMGGMHHAKKSEAFGRHYVNDIVLGILELLKNHKRVLYVDIDVHHGDGVEEAFYTTDRVMSVSFHKYGEFFPGTGDLKDVGAGKGRHYSLNVPLRDGVTDESYQSIFKPVMAKVIESADSTHQYSFFSVTPDERETTIEFCRRFLLLTASSDEESDEDRVSQDQEEFSDSETEGDDRRNEHNAKSN